MVVARVIGNDATVAFGQTGSFLELNVMLPVTARGAARVDRPARGVGARTSACALVEGLAATDRGPKLVEQGLMLATALAPEIGYDAAAALAKEALKSGRTIRELATSGGSRRTGSTSSSTRPSMTEPGLGGGPAAGADRSGRGLPASADRYNPRRCPRSVPGTAPGPCPSPSSGRRQRGGRGAARRAADGGRAVHLHARRRAPVRDAPDAHRGARLDGPRRGDLRSTRSRSGTRARRRSSRRRRSEGTTGGYEVWVSDGTTVQTYVASRKLGTRSAGAPDGPRRRRRPRPAGPLPGLRAADAAPGGDAAGAVHPPRGLLPERPGHRRLRGRGDHRPSRAARRSCSSAITRGRSR